MKKVFMMLLLLALPLNVNAMSNEEVFHVGDSVTVGLTSDTDEVNFIVLKESQAGESTVTLIYDGTIAGSSTIYDEIRPDDGHDEVTTVLDTSVVGQKLSSIVNADGKKWRSVSTTLLQESDLINLGVTKNAAGKYEITEKYSKILAPVKIAGLVPKQYNYWTSIQDTSAADTSMYCVTYNEARTTNEGVWATLESMDITSTTNNSECAIRPVIVMPKEYILCNNTQTPSIVPTGVSDYIVPLASILLFAGLAVVLTRKKNLFQEI